MQYHRSHKRAAFTLIELLTVIAIIGILAAIIIPTVGNVQRKAQKTADLSNMKQVLSAAAIYAGENNGNYPKAKNRSLDPAATAPQDCTPFVWAGLMAKSGGITDPSFYISKLDSIDPIPTVILNTTKTNVDSAFTAAVDLSVEMVVGVKQTSPSTTPLIFTRGLTTTGSWDPVNGVYGADTDGIVGFVGGNVVPYKSLKDDSGAGVLTNVSTNVKTFNVIDTLTSTQSVIGTKKSSLNGSKGS